MSWNQPSQRSHCVTVLQASHPGEKQAITSTEQIEVKRRDKWPDHDEDETKNSIGSDKPMLLGVKDKKKKN